MADKEGSRAPLSAYEWALVLFASTVVVGGTIVGVLATAGRGNRGLVRSVLFYGVPIYFLLLALFIWRERRRAP